MTNGEKNLWLIVFARHRGAGCCFETAAGYATEAIEVLQEEMRKFRGSITSEDIVNNTIENRTAKILEELFGEEE